MPHAQDCVTIEVPLVLRDRVASLRLHRRQPLYEVLEEALDFWESCGAWVPHTAVPVDA